MRDRMHEEAKRERRARERRDRERMDAARTLGRIDARDGLVSRGDVLFEWKGAGTPGAAYREAHAAEIALMDRERYCGTGEGSGGEACHAVTLDSLDRALAVEKELRVRDRKELVEMLQQQSRLAAEHRKEIDRLKRWNRALKNTFVRLIAGKGD